MPRTEVLVIGAGPGGYVAAIRLGQLGKQVTLVDEKYLGGVCLNVGCIPSKALIHAAKTKRKMEHAGTMGLEAGPVKVDLMRLQQWKGDIVARLVNGIAQLEKANKVAFVKGRARLTGPKTVEVKSQDGNLTTYEAEHILLAAGGRPVEIPGFAIDGKRVLSSTEALELTEVPRTLCVIGGGVIGLELGTAWAHLGAKVTVVELMDQLLPGTDPELVRIVAKNLRAFGIEAHTKAKAKRLTPQGVEVELEDGKLLEVPGEKVLLSVGRKPNTDTLGLDKAGVKTNAKGIVEVDHAMRTNVPHIFAIGDITPVAWLAHKASHEGLVAAEAIAGHEAGADWHTVPAVIFTDPEVATAGISEPEARAKGLDIVVGKFPFAASGRALSTGDSEGFVKVVADAKSKVVLGVHIVGPAASDLISEAALAIEMGATLDDLILTVHPHPTLPEALMEAAEVALGKPIHVAKPAGR
jgi:dihydrolipoamide dehydrogenase